MNAGLIVAIVVVVVVLIALVVFAIPRARKAREQRQLEERRGAVVDRHRQEAQDREAQADVAEREAARQRAEADLHQARARVHERGLADDELPQRRQPRGGRRAASDLCRQRAARPRGAARRGARRGGRVRGHRDRPDYAATDAELNTSRSASPNDPSSAAGSVGRQDGSTAR